MQCQNSEARSQNSEWGRGRRLRKIRVFYLLKGSVRYYCDILKYILTAGMIDPFNLDSLSGATCTCNFSGKYYYWDGNKILNTETLDDGGLVLLPNSITFLEIEQYFRIPAYIALRFNLQVPHVYKGLLLGTGPIIDPCFVGRIHIPLHNLTSNEYVIKKGAALINVEFTKLSGNRLWDMGGSGKQYEIARKLDFSSVKHKEKVIKPDRLFMEYAEKALKGYDLFHKKDRDKIYINSSIPEAVLQSRRTLEDVKLIISDYRARSKEFDDTMAEQKTRLSAELNTKLEREQGKVVSEISSKLEREQDKISAAISELNSKLEREQDKISAAISELNSKENFIKTLSIIAILGLMLSAVGIFISAWLYFSGSVEMADARRTLEDLHSQIIAIEQQQLEEGD